MPLGRLSLSAFPVLFIASTLLRLAATLVLVPRIREKGAVPLDRRQLLLPLFFGLPSVGRKLLARPAKSPPASPD